MTLTVGAHTGEDATANAVAIGTEGEGSAAARRWPLSTRGAGVPWACLMAPVALNAR